MAKKKSAKRLSRQSKPSKAKTPSAPKKTRKPGVKAGIAELLSAGGSFTVEQLGPGGRGARGC
jgi:hypothetical protein